MKTARVSAKGRHTSGTKDTSAHDGTTASKRTREDLRSEIRAILAEENAAARAADKPAGKKKRKTAVEEDSEASDGDSDTSEQLSSGILSQMLAVMKDTGDGKGEHTSRFRPFQSHSAPLGAALPAALKKKIQNGDFVHLETLLPSYKNELSICLSDTNSTEGKVSFSTSKNATINTFDQWQDAMLIYGSVLLGAHPEEGVGLLKHMSVVKRLYNCRAKWLWYDGEFRRLRAEERFEFATYHHELVEQAKSYRVAYDYQPRTNPPHRSDGSFGSRAKKVCYTQLNNSGNCYRQTCNFSHTCGKCNGDHPNNRCSGAGQQSSQGSYRPPGPPQEGTNSHPRGQAYKLPPRVFKK